MSSPPADARLTLAAFAVMVVLAAASPIAVAIVVEELDPLWAAASRLFLGGLIFCVAALLFRSRLPRGRALTGAVLYGVVGFFLPFSLIFWGLLECPPGTSGMLLALVPLMTIVLARLHGIERLAARSIIGAVIAILGVGIIVADRISFDVPVLSILAIMVAGVCFAETNVILKLTPQAEPIATNAIALTLGGLLIGLLSLAFREEWTWPSLAETQWSLAFLIFGGSVGVFGLYVFIIARWTATAISYELFLTAVITPVFSAVILGEAITWPFVVGGVVVLAGVYIGVFSRRAVAVEVPIGTVEAAYLPPEPSSPETDRRE